MKKRSGRNAIFTRLAIFSASSICAVRIFMG
jgi:hypothetical protein